MPGGTTAPFAGTSPAAEPGTTPRRLPSAGPNSATRSAYPSPLTSSGCPLLAGAEADPERGEAVVGPGGAVAGGVLDPGAGEAAGPSACDPPPQPASVMAATSKIIDCRRTARQPRAAGRASSCSGGPDPHVALRKPA
ncbi:hypothetical protein GCM10023334_049280 [Nonomuraea thailandensis]